jgi:L-rhamnose mutarotase
MTAFTGLRTRLKPGMLHAYKEAHDAIWPEILEAQSAAGIKRYLIFRDGLDLFHAVEVDDFDAADEMLRRVPIDQRWQAEMAKFVVATDDQNRPGAVRLELVYDRSPADDA